MKIECGDIVMKKGMSKKHLFVVDQITKELYYTTVIYTNSHYPAGTSFSMYHKDAKLICKQKNVWRKFVPAKQGVQK